MVKVVGNFNITTRGPYDYQRIYAAASPWPSANKPFENILKNYDIISQNIFKPARGWVYFVYSRNVIGNIFLEIISQMKNILEMIKKDARLSFWSEEKLELEGFERISATLTTIHRFILSPLIAYVFIAGITNMLLNVSSVETYMIILSFVLAIFVFYFYGYRFLSANHAFFDRKSRIVLIFLPYKYRIISVNKDNIYSVDGTTFNPIDFVTIRVREGDKVRKYHFVSSFRFFKAYTEHPIVKNIREYLR